ncbi:hypothetical protein [Lacinutrix undariae]
MKKLAILALALITFQANAQRDQEKKGQRQDRMERIDDFTPQQIATLKTKQMTLALDLSESQQKKIQDFNFEEATFRKTKMESRKEKRKESDHKKPSKEERFEMMNSRLDHQIAQKQTLKKILTADQFEKFEASKQDRKKNNKKRKGKAAKQKDRKHNRD